MKKFLAAIVALIVAATTCAAVLASAYVGNSNTKKFHYADCSSVGKMKAAHRVEFSTRDEAVAAGYVPCKRCKP